jgi:8-oxo-dGTP diphosphatase
VILDGLVRVAYRCAYWCARGWWFVRRPRTRGAAVAVWSDGHVLLVKTSYRRHYSLPGGFVKRNEAPERAASRELMEEVGLSVPAENLVAVWEGTEAFEHHHDTLTIFEAPGALRGSTPQLHANGRELVWIGWKTAEESRALLLLPHVRRYLDARAPPPT